MEIILNEQQLKTILNEEIIDLIKEAEYIKAKYFAQQRELEKQEKIKQILKVINSEFAFYGYFDDYAKKEDCKLDAYSYVVWRDYTVVFKMYLDLILEFGKELVNEAICDLIQDEIDKEQEME